MAASDWGDIRDDCSAAGDVIPLPAGALHIVFLLAFIRTELRLTASLLFPGLFRICQIANYCSQIRFAALPGALFESAAVCVLNLPPPPPPPHLSLSLSPPPPSLPPLSLSCFVFHLFLALSPLSFLQPSPPPPPPPSLLLIPKRSSAWPLMTNGSLLLNWQASGLQADTHPPVKREKKKAEENQCETNVHAQK